ncbi:MAG: hypothetical protein Q4A55_06410 [Aerococcus sp.]|nr:hypothetical protein [Aerococcus sp.]
MHKKLGYLATAALALALAGCGTQAKNQTSMYQNESATNQSESSSASSSVESSSESISTTTSDSSSESTSEASSVADNDQADQAVKSVSVEGKTWDEQESSVKKQVNDDQVQTVRANLTAVKPTNKQASQSESKKVKSGHLLESNTSSSDSSNQTANDPESKAAQKAKEQVANMDSVPDQTENRIIIAKTNNLSVHDLDQYSDAEILEARLVAENLGSDAGYSYRYLTQNYQQQSL